MQCLENGAEFQTTEDTAGYDQHSQNIRLAAPKFVLGPCRMGFPRNHLRMTKGLVWPYHLLLNCGWLIDYGKGEGRVYSHGPSGDPTYSSDAVWIVPNSWLHTWPFKLCNNSNYWKELIKAEGVGRFGKEWRE